MELGPSGTTSFGSLRCVAVRLRTVFLCFSCIFRAQADAFRAKNYDLSFASPVFILVFFKLEPSALLVNSASLDIIR